MGKLNNEEIIKKVEEVLSGNNRNSPRKFRVMQYCKGAGKAVWRDEKSMNLCNHPECLSCNSIKEVFEKEVEKLYKKLDND